MNNDSAPLINSGKRPGREGGLDDLTQPHPNKFLPHRTGRFSEGLQGKLELAEGLGLLKNNGSRFAANLQRLGIPGSI
jgi:hypothetical protein